MEMLIRYTPKTKHIKCVPLFTKDGNIKLTRSQVELHPGVNEVSEDEWTVMKTILGSDNEITVIKAGKTDSPATPPKTVKALKDVSSAQAVEIVKNCSSGETLKKWYRSEVREIVLLAILKQLKKINVDPFEDTADETNAADKTGTADDDLDPKNPDPGNEGGKGKTLDKMTKEELLAFAAEKGITVAGTKDEIRAALEAVFENDKGAE
jgi:hypothetical protein